MTDQSARLQIVLVGPFRVLSGTGADITPKGAKNQALLALLALSPGLTRPRRWVEDKLWSTFGAEQASANLRQSLSKLRQALGAHREALQADRNTVWLDRDAVIVDMIDGDLSFEERAELLEGMDARDPEFEDWLRIERTELQSRIASAMPQPARGIMILCRSFDETQARGHFIGDILANQIGEGIAEHVRAWRQATDSTDPAATLPDTDVQIDCQLVSGSDGYAFYIKAVHKPSARILYTKLHRIARLEDALESEAGTARTIFEAADQIVGKLPQVLEVGRPEARATALSRLGLYRMFSYERNGLREALGLMRQAEERDRNGVYIAWSALIRMIQMTELAESEHEALREEAETLLYQALEAGSDNPLIPAILSRVRAIALKDVIGSQDMAQTAYERNPGSAFACVAMAEANLNAGRHDAALEMSARARLIARSSPFRHWWDTGHCVIALACNRPQEAIEAGEAAARAAPMSRPALRHLLALYAAEGRTDKALGVAAKLGKIEPGFTLDRMVNDETYPVRTIRKMGLLEPLRTLL